MYLCAATVFFLYQPSMMYVSKGLAVQNLLTISIRFCSRFGVEFADSGAKKKLNKRKSKTRKSKSSLNVVA